jgi:two-component system response regulator RpaA
VTRAVFSTGQAAKVLRVRPETVRKWFAAGRLKGDRLEGSGQIRIPRDELARFIRDHGFPSDWLDTAESQS